MKRFFFIITPARSWRKQQQNKRFGHDAFYGILAATWFFCRFVQTKKGSCIVCRQKIRYPETIRRSAGAAVSGSGRGRQTAFPLKRLPGSIFPAAGQINARIGQQFRQVENAFLLNLDMDQLAGVFLGQDIPQFQASGFFFQMIFFQQRSDWLRGSGINLNRLQIADIHLLWRFMTSKSKPDVPIFRQEISISAGNRLDRKSVV